MSEVMWRLLWIVCAASLVAYASYLFFGSTLAKEADHNSVIALDQVSAGKHELKGVIVIPSKCHGVSLKVMEFYPNYFHLRFQTWQEPYRDCPKELALHAFNTIIFGPSLGSTFLATLDGTLLDLHVIESFGTSMD